MTDAKPSDVKLAGWDLIVYLDDYVRTRQASALAALARQHNGQELVIRLAAFFSAAVAISHSTRMGAGEVMPKPTRPTPASKSTWKR